MRSKSTAYEAGVKVRPSLKAILWNVAGGIALAFLVYPAVASAPITPASVAAKREALAASPLRSRFKGGYLGRPVRKFDRDPKEQVTVVVQMSSASIASARALIADHKLSDDAKAGIHSQADAEQAALIPSIEARGGRVLAQFKDALNGVKVQIARGELDGLKAMPGVLAVLPVTLYHRTNVESVPYIGAPLVWQSQDGFKGKGEKIAIIDTGIDYTHANFGGPGTTAAFDKAAATSTQPASPDLFGPKAPKVKGGIDLAGDAYDPSNNIDPVPDSNPLDCEGHGSHVAGTAAGFGVGTDGKTYHGQRNSAAYVRKSFSIGPGVAPDADLYAVRVFGCTGDTNLIADAIDWAVKNDMDVINMSLGADYGATDSAENLAVKNATAAGVVVVASAGNAGPAPYIVGAPSTLNSVISVAAVDSHKTFPGAAVGLSTGKSIEALNANGVALPGGLDIVVLRTASGDVSLGCDDAEYVDSKIAGKLVVTLRGTCDRVARPMMGQKHGAAAVAMINTDDGYPPYEGAIPGVTIPFLGILPADAPALTAAPSATKFAANTIANPGYSRVASFSSGGPRIGDSGIRPSVSAPGVSIFSTSSGTGNAGEYESGTSMSSPHVAGVAALAVEAHPKWNADAIRAAITETASPKKLLDFAPRLEGSGLVQPVGATKTQAVVVNGGQADGISKGFGFGFAEFSQDFKATREMTLWNYGDSKVDFKLSTTPVGGSPHTATLSQTHISLEPHSNTPFKLTLAVPAKTVGATHDDDGNDAFQEVAGYVSLSPESDSNQGVALTVPYYLVPRTRSNVFAFLPEAPSAKEPTQSLLLGNYAGAIAGNADLYSWGLAGNTQAVTGLNTRAVGVQSNLISPTESVLVFAISTFKRFSTSNIGTFEIYIDTNNDGKPDFDVIAIDEGLLTTGSFSGVPVVALINLADGSGVEEAYVDSPTDGSTILLPVFASDMGITPANPRFSYTEVTSNALDGTTASLPGKASFNAFKPALTNAVFAAVPPGVAGEIPITLDAAEFKKTPPKGLMVVVTDNFSGTPQAQLIPVK